jgi:hypothetical protein
MSGADPIPPIAGCVDGNRYRPRQRIAACVEWSDQEMRGGTKPPRQHPDQRVDPLHRATIAAHRIAPVRLRFGRSDRRREAKASTTAQFTAQLFAIHG